MRAGRSCYGRNTDDPQGAYHVRGGFVEGAAQLWREWWSDGGGRRVAIARSGRAVGDTVSRARYGHAVRLPHRLGFGRQTAVSSVGAPGGSAPGELAGRPAAYAHGGAQCAERVGVAAQDAASQEEVTDGLSALGRPDAQYEDHAADDQGGG